MRHAFPWAAPWVRERTIRPEVPADVSHVIHSCRYADHGLHYDTVRWHQSAEQGNAAQIAMYLLNGKLAEADAQIATLLDAPGDVILSSEFFAAVGQGAVARRITEAAQARGMSSHVILYVRRQDLWLESDFKQHIKGGVPWVEPLSALLDKRFERHILNYNMLAQKWERHALGGPVTLVPLNKGQARSYPVEVFLRTIGAAGLIPEGGLQVEDENVSPPTVLIEPARQLKAELLEAGYGLERALAMLDVFFDEARGLPDLPKRRFLMPTQQRAQIVAQFAKRNTVLGTLFLNGAEPFDAEVAQDPGSDVPLEAQGAEILAAWRGAHPGGAARLARMVDAQDPTLRLAGTRARMASLLRRVWPGGRR